MNSGAAGKIDDGTVVPVAWLFKAFGFIMVSAGVVWWAASITTTVKVIEEKVQPIQQMQQDIAILKEQRSSPTSAAVPVLDVGEPAAPVITAPKSAITQVTTPFRVSSRYVNTDYRFQFDDCHGSPGRLVLKSGRSFILDNRDGSPITIAFAGKSYRVPSYSSALASTTSVGTHQVTCNGGGAATLIVSP